MTTRKFTIECEVNERWVDQFCSMLHYMESCGNLGHSSVTAFYTDGDGDFRPKFNINTDYKQVSGFNASDGRMPTPEIIFDAG